MKGFILLCFVSLTFADTLSYVRAVAAINTIHSDEPFDGKKLVLNFDYSYNREELAETCAKLPYPAKIVEAPDKFQHGQIRYIKLIIEIVRNHEKTVKEIESAPFDNKDEI